MHLVGPDVHRARVGIEVQIPVVQHGSRRSRALEAPQHRADAAAQLRHADRLGHVVVGARLEREDDIGLAVARGQRDHVGAVAGGAQAAADLDAVGPRAQPDVEQHEVVGAQGERVQRGSALPDGQDAMAVGAQRAGHDVAQVGLVLDDEYAAGEWLGRGHCVATLGPRHERAMRRQRDPNAGFAAR
jgi:hypothetical protein